MVVTEAKLVHSRDLRQVPLMLFLLKFTNAKILAVNLPAGSRTFARMYSRWPPEVR